MKKALWLIAVFTLVGGQASFAQKKKKKEEATPVASTEKKAPEKKKEAKGPKTFKDFIDSTAVSQYGLFGVHFMGDKWYFEIGDTLMGRELMTISRYAQTAANGGIYGGELVNKQVVKWEIGPKDKLFLRSVTLVVSSPDSTKPIYQAVRNSSADPIVGAFDIKAIKSDSGMVKSYVIDVTSIFEGDEQVFSLDPSVKTKFNITNLKSDRSYIDKIRTYPINTEIKTVKTFGVSPPRPGANSNSTTFIPSSVDAGVLTMEFNTSMILLPKVPMKARIFDPRVGYFANQYSLYTEESQKADSRTIAVRWRLEPKNAEDAEKQKQGELIEPAKQIVYYIDPATPEKWKSYIKAGIDDWNVAFENAGWKNAIKGAYWPENDTTMSLEDARFSVIRYFASPISNAYGPNVHDPRSGEILESHIGWYHNVMRLIRNWYLIQTAAVDPRARNMEFDDDLMGQLIRFVSSHEVGHTLGLRHNMGASSFTPVEKLRDNAWLKEHGHTSSIMDYARFNYVAQPEDNIDPENLFPRIGTYDKWVIKWGYSTVNGDENKVLNEWVKEAYKDPFKRFGYEGNSYDPRYQTEDLSDNAMKASDYGIKNLKRIISNLKAWSSKDGESYKELEELHSSLVGQYRRYMLHVTKNIGGVYDNPKTYDMEGEQFDLVPKATQKEAVTFLLEHIFGNPIWLYPSDIYSKISAESGTAAMVSMQESVLAQVLSKDRLARMIEHHAANEDAFGPDELMDELKKGIFASKTPDAYQRNLQKVMVENLISLLKPGKANIETIAVGTYWNRSSRSFDLDKSDLPSIVLGQLKELKISLTPLQKVGSKMNRLHFEDLLRRIEEALKID